MAHDGSESSVVAMLNGSISFDPELLIRTGLFRTQAIAIKAS